MQVYHTHTHLNTYPFTVMMFILHHSMIIKVIFLFQCTGLHKLFEPKHVDVI